MNMNFKRADHVKKAIERPNILVVSKDELDRLADFRTYTEKFLNAENKKNKKISELKKLSYEITKDWENAVSSIKKCRREELLTRRKKVEENKKRLLKEIDERNAMERAKILEEARKLIFYKTPQCRLINQALLASECYRELNVQLDLKKKIRSLEENEEKKNADNLKKETEIYLAEERKKNEEMMKKKQIYRKDLEEQIKNSGSQLRQIELKEQNADKEDLDNLIKELKLNENYEAEQTRKRKEQSRKNYIKAMDDKKKFEAKAQHDEEIENRLIAACAKTKEQLNKITKKKWKQCQADKIRRSELMVEKCAAAWKTNEEESEESVKKAQEESGKIALERAKFKQIMREKVRNDMNRYQMELALIKKKRDEERKSLIAWETLQRHKNDELNEEMKLKDMQRLWQNKMNMANDLRQQMAEQKAAREQESIMNDDSANVKAILERTNEKVMAYSQDILEESRGVRPLFPIIKAIETFKKSSGLMPLIKYEEMKSPKKNKTQLRRKHINPISTQEEFCLG